MERQREKGWQWWLKSNFYIYICMLLGGGFKGKKEQKIWDKNITLQSNQTLKKGTSSLKREVIQTYTVIKYGLNPHFKGCRLLAILL